MPCFDGLYLKKSRSACSVLEQNINISFGPNGALLGARWWSSLRAASRSYCKLNLQVLNHFLCTEHKLENAARREDHHSAPSSAPFGPNVMLIFCSSLLLQIESASFESFFMYWIVQVEVLQMFWVKIQQGVETLCSFFVWHWACHWTDKTVHLYIAVLCTALYALAFSHKTCQNLHEPLFSTGLEYLAPCLGPGLSHMPRSDAWAWL